MGSTPTPAQIREQLYAEYLEHASCEDRGATDALESALFFIDTGETTISAPGLEEGFIETLRTQAIEDLAANNEHTDVFKTLPVYEIRVKLDRSGVIRNAKIYMQGRGGPERHFANDTTTPAEVLTWANHRDGSNIVFGPENLKLV